MMIFGILLVLLISMFLEYLFLVPFGAFWSTYFFFGFMIIFLVAVILFARRKNFTDRMTQRFILGGSVVFLFIIAIIISFANSSVFRAESYGKLLPTPTEKVFSQEIEPFDVSKAPIVTESTARQVADRAISQDGTIGSSTQINFTTLQSIKGRLYYVAPLEYSGFFAWLNNKNTGTPYVIVDANNKNCELVKAHIRYQPKDYFSQDLARKLFFTNAADGYTDFTFEIDDNKHPYWTASVYKNSVGFGGKVVSGTAVVDAETGAVKLYSVANTPSWVDRIQPQELVVNNINMHGEYIHGFSPFNDNDKFRTTQGTGMIYNNKRCYYYNGITSVGKDESSIGFYLVDSRTMETTYFRLSDATENAAMSSAEGKVQNLGYTGNFPILLNVENKATYFIPLQDKNGLTKLYSMVSVEDHTILGIGETVEECKEDYIKALFSKNQLENMTGLQSNVTGTVKRIGSYTLSGDTYYVIALQDINGYFTVPLTESMELPITGEGDKVTIKYVKSGINNSYTAIFFDNLSIK
jgi:hypothetical protein